MIAHDRRGHPQLPASQLGDPNVPGIHNAERGPCGGLERTLNVSGAGGNDVEEIAGDRLLIPQAGVLGERLRCADP